MSPRARRAFAGIVLAALLAVSAPVQAAGLAEGAFPLRDVWTRAWSWLSDLWTGGDRPPAAPDAREKDVPTPPPHPGPRSPLRPHPSPGEQGSGIDPDG